MSLQGKTAIVTGGSSGIGAATAVALAERGANVLVNYSRNADGAATIVAACREAGAQAEAAQGDVSDDAACRAIVDAAMSHWGRVDVLVNNAGMTKMVAHENLEGLSADDFQRIYAVNVIGTYQMSRAAAPHLKSAGDASIVNVSSVAGLMGGGSSIAYAASKGAMNTITLSLARVLAPEVRVNAVCPGLVETDFWSGQVTPEQFQEIGKGYSNKAVLNRVASSADIAQSILFFVDGDRNVTGQILASESGIGLVL